MSAHIKIKDASLNEANELSSLCRKAYTENFSDHWQEGALDRYLNKVFTLEKIKNELKDGNIKYYVGLIKDEPAGFMKIKLNSSLENLPTIKGLEIEKLYILPTYHRFGLGKALLTQAIKIAYSFQNNLIWLDVIDQNTKAINFYKSMGFTYFASKHFDFPGFKNEFKNMWIMIKFQ